MKMGLQKPILYLAVLLVVTTYSIDGYSVKEYDICPNAEDIMPCICTYYNTTRSLYMDCSEIQSTDQLRQVFKANFRHKLFFELRIVGTEELVPLTTLPEDSFGVVSFERIIIIGTTISLVSERAFQNSYYTLKHLQISNSQLQNFPFENLAKFQKLEQLQLQNNHMRNVTDIISTTLQYLNINNNDELSLLPDTFIKKAPYLLEIYMENIGISVIKPYFFDKLNYVEIIDLRSNKLSTLEANALAFPYDRVIEVILSNNAIAEIEPNAFSGLSCPTDVLLEENKLKEIQKEVFQDIFDSQINCERKSTFSFGGNPLECDCKIAWIVQNEHYKKLIDIGAKCTTGEEIHQLNPSDFEHC